MQTETRTILATGQPARLAPADVAGEVYAALRAAERDLSTAYRAARRGKLLVVTLASYRRLHAYRDVIAMAAPYLGDGPAPRGDATTEA